MTYHLRDRDITRSDFIKLLRPVLKYKEGTPFEQMLPELTIVHLLKKT